MRTGTAIIKNDTLICINLFGVKQRRIPGSNVMNGGSSHSSAFLSILSSLILYFSLLCPIILLSNLCGPFHQLANHLNPINNGKTLSITQTGLCMHI